MVCCQSKQLARSRWCYSAANELDMYKGNALIATMTATFQANRVDNTKVRSRRRCLDCQFELDSALALTKIFLDNGVNIPLGTPKAVLTHTGFYTVGTLSRMRFKKED